MSSAVSSADRSLDSPQHVAEIVPLVPAWRLSRTFTYVIPEKLVAAVKPGSLVRIPLGGRRVRGIVTAVATTEPDPGLADIAGVVIPVPIAPLPMTEVLAWISERYLAPLGQTFARVVPPRVRAQRVTGIEERSALEVKIVSTYQRGPELLEAIRDGRAGTWVLRVALGEDRGRLISELVSAARDGDGTALVAVPEVRYGSLTLESLARWFDVARVDSAVGEATRSAHWIALARGHPVGAGGRGAVLAPAPSLRLVVVDEESHRTYKEDRSPRLDARRAARVRAERQGAVCVLVSAAPSVETGASALRGSYPYVEPSRAADRAARPLIEFVAKPKDRAVSHELHERIRDTLRAGERVALLAPVGGYARALWCATCRRSIRCPRCEAGMIWYSARVVRCPRCKLQTDPPDSCPHCGGSDFRFVGAGTERLAEQLQKSFPRATVGRMDPASVDELDPRTRPAPDIYVTTWIGTKEAIRPEVSLVGVLDADALIRKPDFRSSELAYQALVEMAEWAGPASSGGRLLVQTDEVGHHALQALVRNDYSFFLTRELPLRQELGYPPFAELIKVQAVGAARQEAADRIARTARALGASVLGPIEVGIEEPRSELLLKCHTAESITPALRPLVENLPPGTRLRIDVDPR